MKIATQKLLLVAGLVWFVAGANILNLGIQSYFRTHDTWLFWLLLIGTFVIFTLFHVMIFNKMVKKHSDRILGLEEESSAIWRFFDTKSYIIMAVMMGGGIALRASGIAPDWFIAFFYTGLGTALLLAGLSFIYRYKKSVSLACPALIGKQSDKSED